MQGIFVKNCHSIGTSLVELRIHPAVLGTQVQALIWELRLQSRERMLQSN